MSTDLLQAELKGTPNSKTLQALLQGSVRLQVNAGPQEVSIYIYTYISSWGTK